MKRKTQKITLKQKRDYPESSNTARQGDVAPRCMIRARPASRGVEPLWAGGVCRTAGRPGTLKATHAVTEGASETGKSCHADLGSAHNVRRHVRPVHLKYGKTSERNEQGYILTRGPRKDSVGPKGALDFLSSCDLRQLAKK